MLYEHKYHRRFLLNDNDNDNDDEVLNCGDAIKRTSDCTCQNDWETYIQATAEKLFLSKPSNLSFLLFYPTLCVQTDRLSLSM